MDRSHVSFNLGALRCTVIRDMDEGSFNVLLVDTGRQRILLDPGMGADVFPGGSNCGQLRERLMALGVAPTNIDLVIFSHADIDHVCGAVDADGQPAFPNARYLLLEEELAFWASDPERLRPHEWYDDAFRQACRELPPARLAQIRSRLEPIPAGSEPAPGVRILAAPGHTPGHAIIEIVSGAERLWFVGDLFYESSNIADPEWFAVFDFDPPQAIATRQRILPQAAREQPLVMGFHLPFPGIGRVTEDGNGWCWTACDVAG
jgi:glyoxylase-like metal-dependent hydrolase (beta-lactamase superfamily II)